MADKVAQHPVGSVLQHQNGSAQMYLRASQHIKKFSLVKASPNGNVILYAPDELKLPEGMATEEVACNEYSFFLIKGGIDETPNKIFT